MHLAFTFLNFWKFWLLKIYDLKNKWHWILCCVYLFEPFKNAAVLYKRAQSGIVW